MSPFFLRLKEQTKEFHELLDSTLTAKNIMSPSVSIENYSNYLSSLYMLHGNIENIVFPLVEKVVIDLPERRKQSLIVTDLTFYGHSPVLRENLFNENYKDSVAFNLGMIYVSEGSTLGGLYILKNINSVLGSGAPSAFLSCYGEKTGARWKSFLEYLGKFIGTSGEEEERDLISGAVYAYQRTYSLFSAGTI